MIDEDERASRLLLEARSAIVWQYSEAKERSRRRSVCLFVVPPPPLNCAARRVTHSGVFSGLVGELFNPR